jgi:L-asparagine transporter-like permease
MASEVKEIISGFIFAVIGITVGAYMLAPLGSATEDIPNWVGGLITLFALLGILLFAVKAFGIAYFEEHFYK